MQMQGMSLIETNLKMAHEGQRQEDADNGLPAKQTVLSLMDDDFPESKIPHFQTGGDWQPRLRKTETVGMAKAQHGRTWEWPKYEDLSNLHLGNRIKLNGFGFKANTNLYQLKFRFTEGESETFNSMEGTSPNPSIIDVHPEKEVGSVEILVRTDGDQFNIYGIRFNDLQDRTIQERQWRRSGTARWVKIMVPVGMEIIGFHGSHDGQYIKQLGLILWKPNPKTLAF